jgi:hypothetical protein
MFGRNTILKTIIIFIGALALVACAPSDEDSDGNNGNNQQGDAGADAIADAGDQDGGSSNDASSDDGDAQDDAVDSGDECVPEEVAAQQVAANASVNDGDVTVDDETGTLTIDASSGGVAEASNSSFVYIDLDGPAKLDLSDEDAFENTEWDIALRRTVIRINGGDSGPGGWLMASMGSGWDDAAQPPGRNAEWKTDDFVTDSCELVTTQRGSIVTAFGQWYDYNPQTHEVSAPESTTWALYNQQTHGVVKLGIPSYADGTYEMRVGSFE